MKTLIIFLFPLFTFSQNWLLPEQWIDHDKELHIYGGALIGTFGTGVTYTLTENKLLSIGVGTGLSVLVAHWKEQRDRKTTGYNQADFWHTSITGAAFSITFTLIIDK